MGLLSAHAACEAMLGLMIGTVPYAKGKPRERYFPDLLELAAPRARPRLTQALRGDLVTMHDVRNSFIHGGSSVDAVELDRAIEAAHVLAEHVPLPGHRRLVGLPSVVADIIDIEAIGMWLRHADQMRRVGRLRLSADGIARALDGALDRTVPSVRTRRRRHVFYSNLYDELAAEHAHREERQENIVAIDDLTRWVYPMALGTPPATLSYIRGVVGEEASVDIGGHPQPIRRPSAEDPTPADLRRASTLVGRIILRLWAMGSLAANDWDAKLVSLATDFLANPSGFAAGEASDPAP
jgi:hypothetical protein